MTVTVTTAPVTSPPNRYGGDPAAFDAAMQAHLTWQAGSLVDELNAQNIENNAINSNVNAQTATLLGAGLANAAANAQAAIANAATATAQNTESGVSAAASASSAAQAATARDLAMAAWSASTAPAEILSAKSQSLHIGTVVKAIVYDTGKDSDGGAWRKRCQDKSWYIETLGGDRWIGQQATIAAAWTAAGSVTGAVFQASATAGPIIIGKYYSANSATTVTEVFRGISREFPVVAGIVAESARVVIYDLSTGAMWATYAPYGVGSLADEWWRQSNRLATSVAAVNGKLFISISNGLSDSSGGLLFVDFVADKAGRYYSTTAAGGIGPYSVVKTGVFTARLPAIVSPIVNDVAITVLDKSFLNPATGLPEPTIFVGTAGGLSTITNSGTVVNSTSTVSVTKCVADGTRLTTLRSDGVVSTWSNTTTIAVAPDTTYTASSTPAVLGTVTAAA